MVAFIDAHRAALGVESICSQLPIAPSTYYAQKACQANPELRSKRAQRDEWLEGEITRVRAENFDAYGAYKVWRQLRREGVIVARCTVERLHPVVRQPVVSRHDVARQAVSSNRTRRIRSPAPPANVKKRDAQASHRGADE